MSTKTNLILLASIFFSACSANTDAKPSVVSPNHPGNGKSQIGETNYSSVLQPASIFETYTDPIQKFNIVPSTEYGYLHFITDLSIIPVYLGDTEILYNEYNEDDGILIKYEGSAIQITGISDTIVIENGYYIVHSGYSNRIYVIVPDYEYNTNIITEITDQGLKDKLRDLMYAP